MRINAQRGFSLIEVVAILILVGLFAVVVLPRYMDLVAGTQAGAAQSVVAELEAASAMNYVANTSADERASHSAISIAGLSCAEAVKRLFQSRPLSSDYQVSSIKMLSDVPGEMNTCTFSYKGEMYDFSLISTTQVMPGLDLSRKGQGEGF